VNHVIAKLRRISVLAAGVLVAVGVVPAEAQSVPALAPSYGVVSGEGQDPAYQYRSMPALQYVSWTDPGGVSRQRFIRSFQISRDDGSLKTRVQYHVGGSMTETANWRPALDAVTGRELLYSTDFAKVNNLFRAANGHIVAMDEKAEQDAAGRFVMRRSSADGGASWTSSRASIDMAGATVAPGSDGRMFQRVIRLPDGSLVVPFYAAHGQFGGEYKFAAHLLVSTDEGTSWRRAATVFKSDTNTYSESTVARRADGRLIMITRYDVVADGNRYARLASRVTTAAVNDATQLAAGWGPWTALGFQGVAPVVHAMDQGVLMLVYGRPGNRIAVSNDGGSTWSNTHNFYDNIPTSGCTSGYRLADGTYFPCSSLGSSGYMGVAVTSPRTAFVLGDNCHTNWGCAGDYQYPHGRDDKLWFSTVVLG
jgi:hypothetical protein